jgi:alpha-1,6-mannosyltransferase
LKTLHLTNAWAETSGGIATFYRALIAASNRRRHEIRLIVPGLEEREEQVGDFGKIYHMRAPKAPLNPNYRTIYPSRFLAPGSKIQEILAWERPDLVEISDKYTLHYLGPLLRMRLVAALDYRPILVGLSQERMDDNIRAYFGSIPFAQPFSSAYMKWMYFPFFDHHIANSEYTAGELRAVADGHLIPRGTWIRPMGVDLDHLSPTRRSPEERRRLLQNFGIDDGTLFLYAGRLVPEKNLGLLFDVLARLAKDGGRNYRLLVVGDGIERKTWERKCKADLPGRAFFMGHVRHPSTLADIYANVDIFIHPNPREPFGIAPLEAMASGVPLVVPNVGGVTSYATHDNAWIVNPDVDSFEAAIKEVVANPVLAARRAESALVTAREYRWDRVAASFLQLYEELYRQPREGTKANGSSFYSTPAGRVRAGLIRTMACVAVGGFRLWSKIASLKPKTQGALIARSGDVFGSQRHSENDNLPA